jgi:3-oxoacyl-[acyl-carrier protein] reductase
MNSFQNKIIIVTGGSRGIGKTIAEKFAAAGGTVIITYKNNVDAPYFDSKGIKHHRCDVSVLKEVQELADSIVKEYNKVDVLVNNAGLTKDGLLMRMSEEDWDIVLNTNAKGVFNFTKAVCRQMISQRKGKIVNVSSIVGIIGNAGQANYVASKAAVIGFTKSIARELASRNINVNCVAPGYIDTDMTNKLNENIKKSFIESVPLKRIGKPEDVANAVLFLSSEEADYITGQTLCIDGGMVMQ